MNFIIPLRTPGLILEDLSPRLYLNELPVSVPSAVTLPDIGGGVYRMSNLPDGSPSLCYSLTYKYGDVWYLKVWGGWNDFGGAPERVILPVREAGLDVNALAPTVYRDGIQQVVEFTSEELGSPGDYRLSGWPIFYGGAVGLLTWEPNGEISWLERLEPSPDAEINDTSPLLAEFADVLSSSCTVAPALDLRDGGEQIDELNQLTVRCYLENRIRKFTDEAGRIKTSTACLYFLESLRLVSDAICRFKNPQQEERGWLKPVYQEMQRDENGLIVYCEVSLP